MIYFCGGTSLIKIKFEESCNMVKKGFCAFALKKTWQGENVNQRGIGLDRTSLYLCFSSVSDIEQQICKDSYLTELYNMKYESTLHLKR